MKKSLRNENYGLAWIDVPEAFEDDVENKLPIITAVPTCDIKNDDNKATHLLIEGENYHALTCLNYTHKGKIDVIYIDPPYNTGSDGFRYKDKRILDKYPDGTEVPTDHPLRHSYWLSFMRKRLELAKDLLSEKGVIFISIDDNEFAQLKMLCDQIFDERNFVTSFIWNQKLTGGHDSKNVNTVHEYVFCYAKDKTKEGAFNKIISDNEYPEFDEARQLSFKWDSLWTVSHGYTKNCDYPIVAPDGTEVYPWMCHKDGKKVKGVARWFWSKETYNKDKDLLLVRKDKKGNWKVYKKVYGGTPIPYKSIFDRDVVGGTSTGKKTLENIFGSIKVFDNPKSVELIKHILAIAGSKNSFVLDFFAGSGTTGQAVLEMNEADQGTRQFILCTNDQELDGNGEKVKHKICSDVCHPRLSKVIGGYKNSKKEKVQGLGGSLKYYRVGFVGEHSILNTNDKDKLALAHNACELLAIAENTLDGVTKNSHFEIFENKDRHTAIYFKESFDKFDDFTKKVLSLKKPTTVYIFSWENDPFVDEFEDNPSITVKTIPEPILEIYRRIHNL